MKGIFSGFSENDGDYIRAAIHALTYSEGIDEATLVRRVFGLAKSAYAKLEPLSGTPHELLDEVFSGAPGGLADMTVLKFEDIAEIPKDLSVGDVLVFEGEGSSGIPIYDGESFVSLTGGGEPCKSYTDGERFAILRPTLLLDPEPNSDFEKEELSEAQTALLATAEAYFMRGYRAQYDDSRFTRVGGGEFRWQIGVRNPEDYTADRWGYINCAAFTYELYRVALGFDLGSLYTTYNLMRHYSKCGFSENEPMYPFYYVPNPNADESERARIESEFLGKLRVGDLAVVRRNNGSGHVLMYIGGGRFVHSTGSSYNYKESFETHEPTVLVIGVWEYFFNPVAKNYIFSESGLVTQLCIVRPLDVFSGEIPENTQSRVKNMRGIFSEKLSDSKGAHSVNAGEEITYTFKIKNLTEEARFVDICDAIPCGTEFVCGDFDRTGERLSACVTLAAKKCTALSYTVRVLDTCSEKICDTGATVGGVKHACAEISVKKTLSEKDREAVARAVEYFVESKESCASGAELVNKIYERAGLGAFFDSTDIDNIEHGLFVAEEFYLLREGGKYTSMIASTLYGGRNLQTENRYSESCKDSSERVRLPRLHDFMTGDLILLKNQSNTEFYIYTGKGQIVNLTEKAEYDSLSLKSRLEGLLAAYNYFVVLRI